LKARTGQHWSAPVFDNRPTLACSRWLHSPTNFNNKYPQLVIGGISRAKHGDEQFWNIEISCSQWEGSACTQSALILFSFKFLVGGGFFFIFPLFPTCFFQVPNGFPI
jgi:hypothetical protein